MAQKVQDSVSGYCNRLTKLVLPWPCTMLFVLCRFISRRHVLHRPILPRCGCALNVWSAVSHTQHVHTDTCSDGAPAAAAAQSCWCLHAVAQSSHRCAQSICLARHCFDALLLVDCVNEYVTCRFMQAALVSSGLWAVLLGAACNQCVAACTLHSQPPIACASSSL